LKNLNSQKFLYEKAERKNEVEVIMNKLSSSKITGILNLNVSKINDANYNSAASNNNTLMLMGSLPWLKFAINYSSSLGSNNTNTAFIIAIMKRIIEIIKIMSIRFSPPISLMLLLELYQVKMPLLDRDLKFNF